ncbi:cathelicidin-4-like [Cervus elaphus]|uniref:cathelicidin-4-like n=1 Tax=Cervus elaphus TaxID=9860 RepID=UPI001CC2C2F1|nr:cathelicidin-4-like [Cervus elaphus]
MACGWNGQGSLRPDLQGWGVDSEECQDQTLLSGAGPRLSIKGGSLGLGGGRLGTVKSQRASLSLGRWSLWLLQLRLVLPSASAQALSYREAVLHTGDCINDGSTEANLYRLLELDPPPEQDADRGARKPLSFRVKETVCPRTSQQPPEQCDFKENGLVKQCVGTASLDRSDDQFDLNCNELQSVRAKGPQPPKPRPPHRPRPRPRSWFLPRFPGKQ